MIMIRDKGMVVVKCVRTEPTLVLCRARHGLMFCNKLGAACAKLTQSTFPSDLAMVGMDAKIPELVAKCMIEEPYVAIMMVEYGFTKMDSWMSTCKITVWNGPITVVQKECVKKQTLLPDPRTVCVKKYGLDFCNKLIVACFEVKNKKIIGDVPCAACELPNVVNTCLSQEDAIAMCYANHGAASCIVWMKACKIRPMDALTQQQVTCIKKQAEASNVLMVCAKKYGMVFCKKMRLACFEVMRIPMPSDENEAA
ncbi:unnamed protein product, partial [Anisakis simplex]|uniref:E1 domain-containing protein n=1 Tax=Anisakis simplex TaxID=6269 RepID=A0A0M3J781_ANISI